MKLDLHRGFYITGVALIAGLVIGLVVVPLLSEPFPVIEVWNRPWKDAVVYAAGMAVAFGVIFSFVKLGR